MGNGYYDRNGRQGTRIDASGRGKKPKEARNTIEPASGGLQTGDLSTGGLATSRLSTGGLSTGAAHDWTGFEAASPKGFLSPGQLREIRRATRPATAMEETPGPVDGQPAPNTFGNMVRKVADAFARPQKPVPQPSAPRFDAQDYYENTGRQMHGWGVTQQVSNGDGMTRDVAVLPTIDEGHEMRTPGWMDATPAQRREMLQPSAVDERGNEMTYGPKGLQMRGYDPARDQSMQVGHHADPYAPNNWTRTVRIDPKYGGGVAHATRGSGHQATATHAMRGQAKAMAGRAMSPEEREAHEKVKGAYRQTTAAIPWAPKF